MSPDTEATSDVNTVSNSDPFELHREKIALSGPWFDAIHISALVVLSLNTLSTIILFIYLCGCREGVTKRDVVKNRHMFSRNTLKHRTTTSEGTSARTNKSTEDLNSIEMSTKSLNSVGSVKNSNSDISAGIAIKRRRIIGTLSKNTNDASSRKRVSFWEWNVGERFVVYLGTCDLMFGISHVLDHAYMLHTKRHPPEAVCVMFGFLLHEFILAQWLVIVSMSVCACALVVFGKKLYLGRWDWKLLLFAFGTPFVLGSSVLPFGILGQSEAWCLINFKTVPGFVYNQIVIIVQIILFGLVALAYGSIWVKIQRTTKMLKDSTTERYQSSARVMLIFVAVFIFQWWPAVLYNTWTLVKLSTEHPPAILLLVVIIVNFGGVYNAVAYTIIRRRLQMQAMTAAKGHSVSVKYTNGGTGDDRKENSPPGASEVTSASESKHLEGVETTSGGPTDVANASESVVEIHM